MKPIRQAQGKRVLSGIRANARLHLGNYLGAIKGMLELQNDPDHETFYMVADLHTITVPYDVETLRKNRREVIMDYLAAGLDSEKSVIFQQANIPEHVELGYLFSSVTTIAKMQHLPTFKEKVKQHPEHATMALLNYPILMAADILVYKASLVPVGLDQEPHLEVAREIARRMNQDYGTDFPEPKRFATKGEYVPSLSGEGKMSKSVEGSYINLTDSLQEIKSKVAKIPTDTGKAVDSGIAVDFGEKTRYISHSSLPRGGVSNVTFSANFEHLMKFVELFLPNKVEQYKKQYQTAGVVYKEIKDELSEAIFKELEPIQKKRAQLEKDPEYVDRVIREGAEKARAVARETVKEVREKMGLA